MGDGEETGKTVVGLFSRFQDCLTKPLEVVGKRYERGDLGE